MIDCSWPAVSVPVLAGCSLTHDQDTVRSWTKRELARCNQWMNEYIPPVQVALRVTTSFQPGLQLLRQLRGMKTVEDQGLVSTVSAMVDLDQMMSERRLLKL